MNYTIEFTLTEMLWLQSIYRKEVESCKEFGLNMIDEKKNIILKILAVDIEKGEKK